MDPMIGIAASVFPDIIRAIAGDKSQNVVEAVAKAVQSAAGTDDPTAAQKTIVEDAAVGLRLRTDLARIAIEDQRTRLDALDKERQSALATAQQATVDDVRAARAGQSALAQADRPTAWVAPVLSLIVTGGFFALLFVLIYKKDLNWSDSVLQIVNISVGALAAAFATVMNFWFGSSLSSRNKDAMVADLQSRQTAQTADVLRQATAVVTGGHVSAFDKARPAPPPASVDGNGDFAICLAFVLHAEGGFVDNPADPGGATNFGITLRTLEAWRRAPVTVADVRSLTEVEAAEIYRANYWDAMRCDRLPKGVDLMVFDFGVNAGPRRSILVLQTAAGAAADGVIGPATLAAVGAASPRELIMKLATLRMDFYRSLPTWGTFGSGWSNRVEAAQRKALAMLG